MSVKAESAVSQINIFPIKSTKGISLSSSWVEKQGLVFDRRFMIAKPDGSMVTARAYPQLVKLRTSLLGNGLVLSYADKDELKLSINEFEMQQQQTQVWGDTFTAYTTTQQADQWLSDLLEEPVRLLYTGEQSNRIRPKIGHNVSFADGYPLLVISEASLAELNRRASETQYMEQFRTNLVVTGDEAFIEDSWKRVRIGEVEFEIRKPCERCILTTVDHKTGQFSPAKEPLKTLSQFRANEKGGVFFGQNLIALNEGCITVGDQVEVLEYKEKEFYADNSSESLKLTCVEKEEVAKDFVTFWFEPTHGVLPEYLPGQYLPIEVDCEGKKLCRYYTLSSSPSRMGRYAISVKRVDSGQVSNWLIENVKVGDVLQADNPQGSFHLTSSVNQPLLLLSAGSGVTPMISMLRYLADHKQLDDVVFYHQCSTLDDIPFKQELDALHEEFSGLKIIISLSQAHDEWQGVKGRLTLSHLKHIPDLEQRQVFVCGPTGFMQKAKNLLVRLGLPESSYHQESFGLEQQDTTPLQKVSIQFNGETIEGDNQSSLLQQVEKAGFAITNSCRAGLCGACRVTLESGDVEHADVPAITDAEREQGEILACCSVPKSDLVVSD